MAAVWCHYDHGNLGSLKLSRGHFLIPVSRKTMQCLQYNSNSQPQNIWHPDKQYWIPANNNLPPLPYQMFSFHSKLSASFISNVMKKPLCYQVCIAKALDALLRAMLKTHWKIWDYWTMIQSKFKINIYIHTDGQLKSSNGLQDPLSLFTEIPKLSCLQYIIPKLSCFYNNPYKVFPIKLNSIWYTNKSNQNNLTAGLRKLMKMI